jgi:UDP-2,3-diacylglucosamine hydrolase
VARRGRVSRPRIAGEDVLLTPRIAGEDAFLAPASPGEDVLLTPRIAGEDAFISESHCRAGAPIVSVSPMTTLRCDREAIFFMADAHLGMDGTEDRGRVRAIASFFERVKETGGALFILGDFFDFWFEYRSVIPSKHFQVLSSMKGLTSAGVEVSYIGGNHDYWIGGFLRDEIGLRLFNGPVELSAQGLRVYLAHGDGLAQRDRVYPVLRGLLHNRLTTAMYRLIHPDLGLPLAAGVSKLSRGVNPDWAPGDDDLWKIAGAPHFSRGFDAVVLGHIHKPLEITRGGKSLYVLGDWITRRGYLLLRDSAFEQLRWK